MKELTRAEEEVMQKLWKLEFAFVKDIIGELLEPKPAYNTVSTIIRILEKKGFVSHTIVGKGHRYFPLVTKSDYSKRFIKGFVSRFFQGSYQEMVSFFTRERDMSIKDLEQILAELKKAQR